MRSVKKKNNNNKKKNNKKKQTTKTKTKQTNKKQKKKTKKKKNKNKKTKTKRNKMNLYLSNIHNKRTRRFDKTCSTCWQAISRPCFDISQNVCPAVSFNNLFMPRFPYLANRENQDQAPQSAASLSSTRFALKNVYNNKTYIRHPLNENRLVKSTRIEEYIRHTWVMSHVMRKRVLCYMRKTKAQISLSIRADWSAPLLFPA